MSKVSAVSFHFLVPAILSYALYYHHTIVTPIQTKLRGFEFGSSFIYITIVANYIQIAYFTLALLNDVFPTPAIKKTKDIIFAGLTIPFAFKTTLMYFGISFIDPELVFPTALRPHFPTWLDITLHSSISVFPIFEILLTRPQFTYRWTSIKVLITGLISYSIWIHVVYFKTGKWVYDIFAELNDIERTVFFAASGIVGIGLYFIGELLSFLLVGSQTKKKQKKSKKSK